MCIHVTLLCFYRNETHLSSPPDIVIFYDDIHEEKHLFEVTKLSDYLENEGFKTRFLHRDALPGINKQSFLSSAMAEADFVLLMITEEPSDYYGSLITMCSRQVNKRLLPVIHGLNKKDYQELQEGSQYLLSIALNMPIFTSETNYCQLIKLSLLNQNLGEFVNIIT